MAHKILDKLDQQRRETWAVVESLSEEDLARPVDGNWTVRNVLTHLLNAEEDHCRVIAVAVRGEVDKLAAPFDLDGHNQARLEARGALSHAQLLEGLTAQRERTTKLFAEVGEAQLDHEVPHPALGETTVGKIFRIIGLHEKMHLKEIVDALQR
ncbi:MAG: DinB family protein [Ardenticatenales bacterium]|nr:DinB family protein [Ardenticatenales bacterium]